MVDQTGFPCCVPACRLMLYLWSEFVVYSLNGDWLLLLFIFPINKCLRNLD